MGSFIHKNAKQFFTILGIYFALRLIFLIYHWDILHVVSVPTLLLSFWWGLRFDISTLLWIQLPFFFVGLWVSFLKSSQWLAKKSFRFFDVVMSAIYLGIQLFFILINVVDLELAQFNGQRLNLNYFMLVEDIGRQTGQIAWNYWKFLLLFFTIAYYLLRSKAFKPIHPEFQSYDRAYKKVLAVIILPVFIIMGLRGGLQRKPIKPTHAMAFQDNMVSNLALNSTFTLIHSGRTHVEDQIRWLPQEEILAKNRAGPPSLSPWPFSKERPKNVVLFIMESFGLEYCGFANEGKGYTPFLDSLSKKSLSFPMAFANGRRSIEAVPSILAGIPSWLRDPFLISNYQGIEIPQLGKILRSNGYKTAFFHGAENGSMFFDTFINRIGIDRYVGRNEYPEPEKDFDGFWGILDEPFFQFVATEAEKEKTPFFYTIFSLSSHQPYPVPAHLRGQFPKGDLEIHESIGYADYSLAQFFAAVKNKDWFKHTLFIITADHTSKSSNTKYQNALGQYRIPMIFYLNGAAWGQDLMQNPVQHVDISPSILDALGIDPAPMNIVGKSVFSRVKEDFVINGNTANGFWALNAKVAMGLNVDGKVVDLPSPLANEVKTAHFGNYNEADARAAKAIVQGYVNAIILNRLGSKAKSL